MNINRGSKAGRLTVTMARRHMLGLAGATLVACASNPKNGRRTSAQPPSDDPPVVVLVAIDGVRHQDVFAGPDQSQCAATPFRTRADLIPHLVEMERAGTVLGAPGSDGFYASGPNFVSLPGYMEMLSGTSHTRCTENDCVSMMRRTLVDDVQAEASEDPTRSGVFSSWSKLDVAAAAEVRGVVSAGRFRGAHLDVLETYPGCRAALKRGRDEAAGHSGFRRDRWTSELALSFFEEARPEFLFVSLGETDERAHEGDYPAYLHALAESDRFVGRLARALRGRELEGRRTLLLVTTDHGRADNFRDHGRSHPESARAFLFAGGSVVAQRGWVPHGRAYLRDIAPTVRQLRGLPPSGHDEGSILRSILI